MFFFDQTITGFPGGHHGPGSPVQVVSLFFKEGGPHGLYPLFFITRLFNTLLYPPGTRRPLRVGGVVRWSPEGYFMRFSRGLFGLFVVFLRGQIFHVFKFAVGI